MGRVLANNVALSYTTESPTALGTLPAGSKWRKLEPNSLGSIGATISTIVRNPISSSRQRKKGTITDLDSSVEFEHDLIYDSFQDLLPGFMFAKGANAEVTDLPVTGIAIAGGNATYTIPAVVAANEDKFETTTLMWLHGFDDIANNGLGVSSDVAATGTSIAFAASINGTQVAKAAAAVGGINTVYGYASICGIRFPNADLTSWTYSSTAKTGILQGAATKTIGTLAKDTGIRIGQLVHFGSIVRAGQHMDNGLGANPYLKYGYARVRSITANSITFDKMSTALGASIAAVSADLDLLFGDFFKSVKIGTPLAAEIPYRFEVEHPDLDDTRTGGGHPADFIYATGNYCNTLGFTLPLTDKATMSLAYIGIDTNPPAVREVGAANATDPIRTEAFNTTADIARLRVQELDEDGLSTDFKSLSININNNVSPEKILARLGAKYMNTGEFAVTIEAQLIFTSGAVITAIRNNDTVTMDFILKNNDGVIGVDIPGMTIGGGNRDYPENESVLVNLTCETFEDEIFESSLGISFIPVPLP